MLLDYYTIKTFWCWGGVWWKPNFNVYSGPNIFVWDFELLIWPTLLMDWDWTGLDLGLELDNLALLSTCFI